MREYLEFYIDGQWVSPVAAAQIDVVNPATELVCGHISAGHSADVIRAVGAASRAFETYSQSSRGERIDLLSSILREYEKRLDDMARAITEEMGAPVSLATEGQARVGLIRLSNMIDVLRRYAFEEDRGSTRIAKEPIGVCGLITPWNWPINQIACKVLPALAAGCTMILKPSESAPFSAYVWTEILHAARVPPGVYNMINGSGPEVGEAIAAHPDIAMVSFTGSTRAGIEVARSAAASVKRVAQELGGKSPNIILPDADLEPAIWRGVQRLMVNSGQSCNAPTRMLAPRSKMNEVIRIAKDAAESVTVGDPTGNHQMGPVVNRTQWEKIQGLIHSGIAEGALLVTGGPGRPQGLPKGYYVRPTVFAEVANDMTIAREEIFGPVLCILPYDTVDEAIAIANDTDYGLAAYLNGSDLDQLRAAASRLRAGQLWINEGPPDPGAPFGGYKKSGNGRECGDYGLEEYLETKSILGFTPAQTYD